MRRQSESKKQRFALSVALSTTFAVFLIWAVVFSAKINQSTIATNSPDADKGPLKIVSDNMANVVSGFDGIRNSFSNLFFSKEEKTNGELEVVESK